MITEKRLSRNAEKNAKFIKKIATAKTLTKYGSSRTNNKNSFIEMRKL